MLTFSFSILIPQKQESFLLGVGEYEFSPSFHVRGEKLHVKLNIQVITYPVTMQFPHITHNKNITKHSHVNSESMV